MESDFRRLLRSAQLSRGATTTLMRAFVSYLFDKRLRREALSFKLLDYACQWLAIGSFGHNKQSSYDLAAVRPNFSYSVGMKSSTRQVLETGKRLKRHVQICQASHQL